MTWTIRLTYSHDDKSHPDFTMQTVLDDISINNADFDVLAYQFDRMNQFMQEKVQKEKT
jgi:ABC-type branched-subunit amino acid transport system substrate-binding protein